MQAHRRGVGAEHERLDDRINFVAYGAATVATLLIDDARQISAEVLAALATFARGFRAEA
jgi:hypothetical protein